MSRTEMFRVMTRFLDLYRRQHTGRSPRRVICSQIHGVKNVEAKYGVGFGSALAITISYSANHSILWAIIHGILSWLYVVYFALFH